MGIKMFVRGRFFLKRGKGNGGGKGVFEMMKMSVTG